MKGTQNKAAKLLNFRRIVDAITEHYKQQQQELPTTETP